MEDPNRVSQETAADEVLAENVDETDETEVSTQGAEQPEKASDKAPAPEASEPEQDDDQPKRDRSLNGRFRELTRKRKEAQAEAEYWKAEAQKNKRPRREDFDTEEAYEDAHEEYRYATRRGREAEEAARRTSQEIDTQIVTEFRSHEEAFIAEAPDYQQVAYTAPISSPVAKLIAGMGEDGPRVAYALGRNHALAREISEMPPTYAAMELGRLAASQRRPQRRLQSKAPPPVSPVTAAGGTTQRDPAKMSPAEYRAWREGSK